ncbi:MAG TPA: hypothetical protein VJ987_10145 [Anaerolineales bacterium]|nr:hypothetical protein [Anaerolineales bacterium]
MEGFNWSILGWIAGLVFVYIFGIFEGRGQGRKQRIAEEEQEKKEQPIPPPVKVDDPGLLRIKNESGTMTLDLDGQQVVPTALTPAQRKRLIEMLNIMRPWLEGKPAAVPTTTNSSVPKPSSAPIQSRPVPTSNAAPPPQPAAQPTPSTPIASAKDDELKAAPTSIVGQINLVLQKNIANTPLASRGVTLMESLSGGVNVYVGVQRYEMIDDVPDEEIKAAIRAAISEWENTYTPGL